MQSFFVNKKGLSYHTGSTINNDWSIEWFSPAMGKLGPKWKSTCQSPAQPLTVDYFEQYASKTQQCCRCQTQGQWNMSSAEAFRVAVAPLPLWCCTTQQIHVTEWLILLPAPSYCGLPTLYACGQYLFG